jgi:hypothetical protein
MKPCFSTRRVNCLIASGVTVFLFVCHAFAQADWAHLGADGKLVYKTDSRGNRIMDFSTAGYMAGGVALPSVAAKVTLSPSGGDDKTAIQNAINQVAALPLVNGFRGAVVLSAGTFQTSGPVTISASGVVVRGSGSGSGGTSITATGGSLFSIAGTGSYSTSNSVNITDAYVPSGTLSVNVSNASGFAAGDNVLISKTVTAAWVHFVGMDSLVRDSSHQTWIAVGTKITTDRTVAAVSGNKITFDAPITDSFDSLYLGSPVGTVSKYTYSGRITQCGVENLKIVAPADTGSFSSFDINAAMDCWVRDIVIQDGVNCFYVEKDTRRLTIENVIINHTVASTNPALPMDFRCVGTQILFDKCQSNGSGSWSWSTGSIGTGPVVVLNFKSTQNTGISPHMRWTTGILADCDTLPDAPSNAQGISFRNRGIMGSGHGWTTAWSVAWNVITPYFLVSNAAGSINWAIGGKGTKTSISGDSDGIYDHFNTIVEPKSLYLEQLFERLGPQALVNIGYGGMVSANRPASASGTQTAPDIHVSGTSLFFTLSQTGDVDVLVFSPNGIIAGAMHTRGNAGKNRMDLAAAAKGRIPAGIYIVNVKTGNSNQSIRFVP